MINKNTSLQQAKDTGMALVLICLIVFLFSHQRFWVLAALFFLLLNMIYPKLFKSAGIAWFKLSHFLGTIISTILLTTIFFIILTPVGLIRKLTGADAMRLKQWKKTDSAFIERNQIFSAKELEKPY